MSGITNWFKGPWPRTQAVASRATTPMVNTAKWVGGKALAPVAWAFGRVTAPVTTPIAADVSTMQRTTTQAIRQLTAQTTASLSGLQNTSQTLAAHTSRVAASATASLSGVQTTFHRFVAQTEEKMSKLTANTLPVTQASTSLLHSLKGLVESGSYLGTAIAGVHLYNKSLGRDELFCKAQRVAGIAIATVAGAYWLSRVIPPLVRQVVGLVPRCDFTSGYRP